MHAEFWDDDQSSLQKDTLDDTGRVLAVTSGNTRSLPGSRSPTALIKGECKGAGSSLNSLTQPCPTYVDGKSQPSNPAKKFFQNYTFNQRNIIFKRLRYRLKLWQNLQKQPEYQVYEGRDRKDVDKNTREIIWTPEMDVAFANALVNIPPMGRRKRSQHGRAFGRNELISEWIKHETGKERQRKQISSHIQVFDKIFMNYPDWRRLSRGLGEPSTTSADINEYYNNSVEDMVKTWPSLKRFLSESSGDTIDRLTDLPILKSNDKIHNSHKVQKLEFEMWIGPSQNVDEHLHDFTRVQQSNPSEAPIPLENVEDWRVHYPDLEPLLQEFASEEDYEVILLNARFRMMDDFPLEQLKLGISFLMEFSNPSCTTYHLRDCLTAASCVTRFYQRGHLLRQSDEQKCQYPASGKIKPPFESKWWAQEFVRLTDLHRMAEDTGNEASIVAAAESSRNFFLGLTMMQQIILGGKSLSGQDCASGTPAACQRATILLWKFDEAHPGVPGVTEWHKIVHTYLKDPANGLAPKGEANVLAMDLNPAYVNMNHGLYGASGSSIDDAQVIHPTYSSDEEEELCQDGYMILAQGQGFALDLTVNPSFTHNHMQAFGATFLQDYSNPAHNHIDLHHGITDPLLTQDQLAAGMIENNRAQVLTIAPDASLHINQPNYFNDYAPENTESRYHEQLLDRFDSETHRRLQVQLANHEAVQSQLAISPHENQVSIWQPRESGNDPMQGCSAVKNMTSDKDAANISLPVFARSAVPQGDSAHALETLNKIERAHSHHNLFERYPHVAAPVAIRPTLQQFHSFAGVLSIDDTEFDTPKRGYNRILDDIGERPGELADENSGIMELDAPQLKRTHSQPLFRDDIRMDLGQFDAPARMWPSFPV